MCVHLSVGVRNSGRLFSELAIGGGLEIGISGTVGYDTDDPEVGDIQGTCHVIDGPGLGGSLGGNAESKKLFGGGEIGGGADDGCSVSGPVLVTP